MSILAAAGGAALTLPTLGWPFKAVSVSVPGEVTRTVVETMDVPVQITRWFFWKATRTETREVTREVKETVYRTEARSEFSAGLLLPMVAVGVLCYFLEKWAVLLAWRCFG